MSAEWLNEVACYIAGTAQSLDALGPRFPRGDQPPREMFAGLEFIVALVIGGVRKCDVGEVGLILAETNGISCPSTFKLIKPI